MILLASAGPSCVTKQLVNQNLINLLSSFHRHLFLRTGWDGRGHRAELPRVSSCFLLHLLPSGWLILWAFSPN